ncbi:MAG TPA: 50S ribosomal protein L17 [Vicinamibacterales bacterium]|nr:50S ribosomal protein L17 [Vicinamibacterales bacterium]
MRHRVAHRKLGRVTEHRIAMLRNQATALLQYEHLTTTVARAKELRPFVERLITIAKRGVADGAPVKALHARRLVLHDIQDREVVGKLFDTLAPRFQSRPGGYTRILRLGFRRGDAAEVAQLELVGSEFNPKAKSDGEKSEAAPKQKGVGGRLKAAAERLRGKSAEAGAPAEGAAGKTKAKGGGAAKQRPRKQGAKGS